MTTALLSIHPEHAQKIISGEKTVEYRRVMPHKPVSHFALYCTAPVSKIVAIVGVEKIIRNGSRASVWMCTAPGGCISLEEFLAYFAGMNAASAAYLGAVTEIEPTGIDELSDCRSAPQSFCYLSKHDKRLLREKIVDTCHEVSWFNQEVGQ